MRKEQVFLRIAKQRKGKLLYKIDRIRNNSALQSSGYKHGFYPTILIKLNIELPEDIFDKAQAELDLKIKSVEMASEIKISEENEKER